MYKKYSSNIQLPDFKLIFTQTRWDDPENDISYLYGSGGHNLTSYISYPASKMHNEGLPVEQIYF